MDEEIERIEKRRKKLWMKNLISKYINDEYSSEAKITTFYYVISLYQGEKFDSFTNMKMTKSKFELSLAMSLIS